MQKASKASNDKEPIIMGTGIAEIIGTGSLFIFSWKEMVLTGYIAMEMSRSLFEGPYLSLKLKR